MENVFELNETNLFKPYSNTMFKKLYQKYIKSYSVVNLVVFSYAYLKLYSDP